MNIRKTTWSTKTIMLSTLIVLVVLALIAATLEKTNVTNFIKDTPAEYTGPTEAEKAEQQKAEQEDKKDFIETPEPDETVPEETAANIELTAKQESNGSVTVLTKLYQVSDGTCTLTISNGGKKFSQTAEVIYQPSFSSCAGFSVAKEKLGAGTWDIKVTVSGATNTEKSITTEVN